MNEEFIGPTLQTCNQALQEDDSVAPHQSLRDSMWVEFMLTSGLSEEDLELAKRVYAYSNRTRQLLAYTALTRTRAETG